MEEHFRETPEIISFVDTEGSKLIFDISMIEVKKEDLTIMVFEGGCSLSCPIEDGEYAATLPFISPVKSSEIKVIFDAGHLRIEAPLRDGMEGAIKLPIE
jgi:hypothetical protein